MTEIISRLKTIKPFATPGFTPFDNGILDYIMPRISANGWKVLCVALRKTWGWYDDQAPNKRRQWDAISYSQFRELTGIKSDTTIERALAECVEAGFLLRRCSTRHDQQFEYALNTALEIEVAETITEPESGSTSTVSVEVGSPTSTVSVENTSTVSVEVYPPTSTETVEVYPPTSTVSVDTKETLERNSGKKEEGISGGREKGVVERSRRQRNKSPTRQEMPPAAQVYHRVFRRYPRRDTWPIIEREVGDRQEQWAEVCGAWQRQQHNPNNLQGMFDWLNQGIPGYAREGGPNGQKQRTGIGSVTVVT